MFVASSPKLISDPVALLNTPFEFLVILTPAAPGSTVRSLPPRVERIFPAVASISPSIDDAGICFKSSLVERVDPAFIPVIIGAVVANISPSGPSILTILDPGVAVPAILLLAAFPINSA